MIQVTLGLDLEVEFDYHKGFPATREDPGEQPYIEVTSVQYNGQEIELTDDDMEKVAEYIYDHWSPDNDGY